jgi:hypothetical protein
VLVSIYNENNIAVSSPARGIWSISPGRKEVSSISNGRFREFLYSKFKIYQRNKIF